LATRYFCRLVGRKVVPCRRWRKPSRLIIIKGTMKLTSCTLQNRQPQQPTLTGLKAILSHVPGEGPGDASISRRHFILQGALLSVGAATMLVGSKTTAAQSQQRKMTMDLVCGNLGISANQREAIELAARHGFESVGVDGAHLATLEADQLAELKKYLK